MTALSIPSKACATWLGTASGRGLPDASTSLEIMKRPTSREVLAKKPTSPPGNGRLTVTASGLARTAKPPRAYKPISRPDISAKRDTSLDNRWACSVGEVAAANESAMAMALASSTRACSSASRLVTPRWTSARPRPAKIITARLARMIRRTKPWVIRKDPADSPHHKAR